MFLRLPNSSINVIQINERHCALDLLPKTDKDRCKWGEKSQSHTGQGTYTCMNSPSGILSAPIKAFNMFTVFEVRTLSGFYPKEIIREA